MAKTKRFQSRRSLHVMKPGQAALLQLARGGKKVHWAGDIATTKRQLLRLGRKRER